MLQRCPPSEHSPVWHEPSTQTSPPLQGRLELQGTHSLSVLHTSPSAQCVVSEALHSTQLPPTHTAALQLLGLLEQGSHKPPSQMGAASSQSEASSQEVQSVPGSFAQAPMAQVCRVPDAHRVVPLEHTHTPPEQTGVSPAQGADVHALPVAVSAQT